MAEGGREFWTYEGERAATTGLGDPVAAVVNGNRRMYEGYARNRKILTVVEQAAALHPEFNEALLRDRALFVERYAKALRQLQIEGRVHADLDPRHSAAALGSMIWDALRWWLRVGEPHDPTVAVETINKLWLGGIGLEVPDPPPSVARRPGRGA